MQRYVEISTDFSAAHFLESEFMHGHNFKIKVKFYGDSGKDGMIVDFDKAKDALDEICNKFDHKIMLSESSAAHKESFDETEIKVREKTYNIAKEDIAFLPIKTTTAEYVAEYIAERLKKKFEDLKISVEIEENHDSSAIFF